MYSLYGSDDCDRFGGLFLQGSDLESRLLNTARIEACIVYRDETSGRVFRLFVNLNESIVGGETFVDDIETSRIERCA